MNHLINRVPIMIRLYFCVGKNFFVLTNIIISFYLFANSANARALHDQENRWKLNNYPEDISILRKSEVNKGVTLDAWIAKSAYKVNEPIMLNLSIQNHSAPDLVVSVLDALTQFTVLLREENRGDLSVNEHGAELRPDLVKPRLSKPPFRKRWGGSRMSVWLSPGEGYDYAFPLLEFYDIGAGNYEVIAQRKLTTADKKEVILLESPPVKFTVVN